MVSELAAVFTVKIKTQKLRSSAKSRLLFNHHKQAANCKSAVC